MNRFQKRQERRRRVFFQSLSSSQIAEIDENGQLIITTFQGYIKKMEPTYYEKSPTFADVMSKTGDRQKVIPGSEDERINADYRIRNGEPLFADPDHGIVLYR
jgi:hypothetical protein